MSWVITYSFGLDSIQKYVPKGPAWHLVKLKSIFVKRSGEGRIFTEDTDQWLYLAHRCQLLDDYTFGIIPESLWAKAHRIAENFSANSAMECSNVVEVKVTEAIGRLVF